MSLHSRSTVQVHERLKDETTAIRASMSEEKNVWLGAFYRAHFSATALEATIIELINNECLEGKKREIS